MFGVSLFDHRRLFEEEKVKSWETSTEPDKCNFSQEEKDTEILTRFLVNEVSYGNKG